MPAGIVAACRRLHAELLTAAAAGAVAEELQHLSRRVQSLADRFAPRDASGAGAWPDPTRRGLGWLRHLGSADNLADHVATLGALQAAAARHTRAPIRLELYPSSVLYRLKRRSGGTHWVVDQGFCRAPGQVIRALAASAFDASSRQALAEVRSYARSGEYARARAAVAIPPTVTRSEPDAVLQGLFEEVNTRYFDSRLTQPELAWGRPARRKLGHYDTIADKVVLTRSLNHPTVPHAVRAFVMFHELLHKALGVGVVKGRRRVHTPLFRREERRFAEFDHVQAWLAARR